MSQCVIHLSSGRWKIIWIAALFLALATGLRADQFDTLRLYWQSNLVNNGSSLTSVANTANGYWDSMVLSSSGSYLWSDLPLGSVSGNISSTYDRLQAMALAWATPGCSLQGNASLASAVVGGLNWMNTNCYTTTAIEYKKTPNQLI